jgi:hypothetical protein
VHLGKSRDWVPLEMFSSPLVCVLALRYITASSLAVCLTCDRRPKGTAFLEFATVEGADTAVAAANKIDNVNTGVLVVKGHQLAVNLALDRDQARNVAKQASIQQDDHDRRHLKLAKASFSSSTTLEVDVYLEVILLQAEAKAQECHINCFHCSQKPIT